MSWPVQLATDKSLISLKVRVSFSKKLVRLLNCLNYTNMEQTIFRNEIIFYSWDYRRQWFNKTLDHYGEILKIKDYNSNRTKTGTEFSVRPIYKTGNPLHSVQFSSGSKTQELVTSKDLIRKDVWWEYFQPSDNM